MAWFTRLGVVVDDAELVGMAYDLNVQRRIGDFASATKSKFQIRVQTPLRGQILRLGQLPAAMVAIR
jgi:hypothetical protein